MAAQDIKPPRAATEDACPQITRRSLLRASPALLAPALLAAPALAQTDTPVLRLFREWDALEADTNSPSRPISDDDLSIAMSRLRDLERRMEAEPCTCLADLAAKVVASSGYGDFELEKWVIQECEAILAGGNA